MLVEEITSIPLSETRNSSTDQSHIFGVPGLARHDLQVARQTTRIQAGIGGWCGTAGLVLYPCAWLLRGKVRKGWTSYS